MNIPEDPFKRFRAVSDPLKSLSSILNSLPTEPPYMRHLESVTGTAYGREIERLQNLVLKSNVYTSEVERIEEYLRKGSAVSHSLELAEQAFGRNSFESIQLATATALGRTAYDLSRSTLLQDTDKFSALSYLSLEAHRPFLAFDSYQRATSWLDPLRDIQSQGILSVLEKYKSLAAATDPLRIYRDAMDALTKSQFRNVGDSQLQGIFDSLGRIAADISRDSFNDVDIEFEQDDVAEYRDLARNSTKGITLSRKDIEDLVTHFISSYQKLTGARERKIFATYIYPLLLALVFSYINPYNDFLVKQKLEAAKHPTEKSVQVAARESGAPAHVLDSFRFISAQSIQVRINGRMKSPMIGKLSFGQPVEVLKREGDWTLIHYSDADSEVALQGWVLSRYLKKFK